MTSQLALRWSQRTAADEAWSYLLPHIREAISQIGLDIFAGEVDAKASYISQALSGHEKKYFRASWLAYLAYRAPTDDLLRAMADLRDHDIVQRKPLEAAEELEALNAAVERHLSPELRRTVIAEARKYARRGR